MNERYDVGAIRHSGWREASENPDAYEFNSERGEWMRKPEKRTPTSATKPPMHQQPEQQHLATDERPTAVETARKAIAAYKKLSPTMRDAVRGAARPTPNGELRVGWTGHVGWRTKSALARRDIMRLSDNALTNFGRFVHAVAVTSEVEVLAWAGRRDAADFIAEGGGEIVISEGAEIVAGDDDPAIVAFRVALLDELHTRALAEDAERAGAEDTEPTQTCATDGHEDRPAIAVHVYSGDHIYRGHGEYYFAYLCRECATCSGDCDTLGDVMQARPWQPLCQRHADALRSASSPDVWVTGPDIVLLDSDRYRALVAREAADRRLTARASAHVRLPRRANGYTF